MPTILKAKYPPTFMGRPPHMRGEDLELWIKSRATLTKEALAIYFDVGIGGQTSPPPGTTPDMALMWLYNTQKRIDVLLETQQNWQILELRIMATANALGRLLAYQSLWNLDPPDLKPTRLILITNRKDQDLEFAASTMGIEIGVF